MPEGASKAKRVVNRRALLAAAFCCASVMAQTPLGPSPPPPPPTGWARPKLTVLLVAEHFRPEYLDRYRASFGAGGFNRLLKGGTVFRECRYEYSATFPASGAAVLATGAYPERNGIIAERWYDRKNARVVGAAEDPETVLVGSSQEKRFGASPRRLIGTTLADELRLATTGHARVVSVSLRPETAVMLGGRKPLGCYWLDDSGRFVTSSYYANALPAWVAEFAKAHTDQRFYARAWKAADAAENAPALRVINSKEAYLASPFALDEELDFAREAVNAGQLGQNSTGDLLAVSLSPFYLLGLETGAESPLMRDMVLRLDRKLEELFGWLDTKLGADKYWVAFTATQGLPESPEALKAEGIPAGHVSGEQVASAVNARLVAGYGRDRYVEKYVFPFLYLRRELVDRWPDAARLAGEGALAVPGVAGYYVPNGASSFQTAASSRPLARSWSPDRGGDVVLVYQPYFTEFYGEGRGVTPGSFYSYDTRVPLLLYGAAFRAQVFDKPATPADLAPTLAAALDIAPPSSSSGTVLLEALKSR